MTPEFRDSAEYALQRLVRQVIRKNKNLSAHQRNILIAICNDWFFHKNGPKKHIHPGRKRLAKKANTTVITVARALKLFREAGIVHVVARPRGEGQKPTQYVVDEVAILKFCGCDIPETVSAAIIEFPQNDTPLVPPNDTPLAYQNDTQYKGVNTHRCQSEVICFSEYNR